MTLVAVVPAATAQNASDESFDAAASAQNAPDESFDAVASRLAQIDTLRGRFEQVREIAALSRPLRSNGRFIISELGLYWEQDEPFQSRTIAGPDGISQQVADLPKVTTSSEEQPIAAAVSQVFMGIFKGDRTGLETHFGLDFTSRGQAWMLDLEPLEYPLTEVIGRIVVEGSEFIDTLRMTDLDGGSLMIRFSNQSTEPPGLSAGERELYSR